MNNKVIVLRETAISMAINAGLSLAFFLVAFGLAAPIAMASFAFDFLPQAFMISLMGSLVPGLLVRKGSRVPIATVVRRAVLLAIAGLILGGGGALALCLLSGVPTIDPQTGLVIKIIFGASFAAAVTPIAVCAILRAKDDDPRTSAEA